MKLFFAPILAFVLLLIPVSVFAAPPYPLEATSTATSITVTMSGVPNDQTQYKLYNGDTVINEGTTTEPWIKKAADTKVVWELTGAVVVPNTTYRFRVKMLPNTDVTDTKIFTSSSTTGTSPVSDFKIVPSSGGEEVTVSGKIDTVAYPTVSNLKVTFYWSRSASSTGEPMTALQEVTGQNGQAAIASDGSYTLKIPGLSPSITYYFKQEVTDTGSTGPIDTKVQTFDTLNGFVAAGSKKEEDLFNSRSYRLLAPWPGLSVLMDPDLCLQQKALGTVSEDAVCDVNGLLNFGFKLLIGLAAVMLVLRIIYEGYTYIVTDVPFLKASAKSGFFTALLGLLLALSAYLILNTLNPKLVNNTISIDSVSVGIEEDDNEIIRDDRFTQDSTIKTNRNCKGKIVDIKIWNGSYIDICDEIKDKVELMFSDAKKDGISLSGGGYRTFKEQTDLYNTNCAGGRKKCNPATARPGSSMHETGKAFDLKCEGSLITFSTPYKGTRNASTKKCFDWLSQNAYKYGLKNLKKENWHWSVNGK